MEYLALAIATILISNVVLENFLGICPFLGVSQKRKQAFGMGVVVIFVIFISSLLTYGLYYLLLVPLHLEYLKIISFILIIAGLVQLLELVIKKYVPSLYKSFGIYLPLITTNCIVLGTVLNNITLTETGGNFLSVIIYSLSLPIGYLLVVYIFAAIRERLDKAPIPKYFKGIPIALITAALMAMAFKGFVGLI